MKKEMEIPKYRITSGLGGFPENVANFSVPPKPQNEKKADNPSARKPTRQIKSKIDCIRVYGSRKQVSAIQKETGLSKSASVKFALTYFLKKKNIEIS